VLVHSSAPLPPADTVDFSLSHAITLAFFYRGARLPPRRDLTPYRSRTRFTALRSRRPIDRHFSWQHVPTFNQLQQKQSREVALRVQENQMIAAHLSGGREYLLNGAARRHQRYKVRLFNHAGTVYARRSTVRALTRRGFSPEGTILSKTSCVCRILSKETLRVDLTDCAKK
jgi:hypothetical protein